MHSYKRLIVVVGANPDKDIHVSPERRADLLRQMTRSNSAVKNTHVQGKSNYTMTHAPFSRRIMMKRMSTGQIISECFLFRF